MSILNPAQAMGIETPEERLLIAPVGLHGPPRRIRTQLCGRRGSPHPSATYFESCDTQGTRVWAVTESGSGWSRTLVW